MDQKNLSIYNQLKRRIIEFEYKPGKILNEVDLAEEFGVSRSPIRSALQELERDALINIVPRFGAQVAPIDFRNIKGLFDVTKQLDPYATRQAVKRITPSQLAELKQIIKNLESFSTTASYQEAINEDERFHQIIFQACDNRWLKETLAHLHLHTERLWHYCNDYFDDMTIFTRTFRKIVQAIEDQDEDAAEHYAYEHIEDFLSRIKEALF
ncbi:GntR family transcriptional regulator [Facklamia miroungae]|uniref:DNA-binding transcriptional regulator, GntR family n=1 Tax=Facklamia miroungae TaxID=120956 RepID=A0A1G7UW10_9LACT|nr:GntR family transcriptional regulator [Facklamia miroungae]NKZ30133.1 GntR family transcriptional regulator [Facklamia miroungae]SDG51329.1 DNA-binding transcriptional regulator, GntR family [Facklamia miroungae]